MTLWAVCQFVPPAGNPPYYTTYLNDTVWTLMRDLGITHVQFWQRGFDNSNAWCIPNNSTWATIIDRMHDFNLEPEMCLAIDASPNRTTDAVDLVQRLGSDCMIYEVCAEPHLKTTCNCNTNMDTYTTAWNEIVTACRDINPTALYGGPAVGIMSSSQNWMNNFLTDCPTTDFATFHYYPTATSQSQALSNITGTGTYSLTTVVNNYKNAIISHGLSIPLAITEHSPSQSNDWSTDLTFQTQYITALFDKCTTLNLHSIFVWDFMGYDNLFCMVRPPQSAAPYAIKAQYTAIKNYIDSGTTGTKQATFNTFLMQQQVKSTSFNTNLISQQVMEATFNASLEVASALCSWGTPSTDRWVVFHQLGDVNDDGVINIHDGTALIAHWYTPTQQENGYDENYDLNGDGWIDAEDAARITANFGRNICDGFPTLFTSNALLQGSGQIAVTSDAILTQGETGGGPISFTSDAILTSTSLPTMPYFADVMTQLKKLATPTRITVDGTPEMVVDGPSVRCDIFCDGFERLKKGLKK